MEELDQEKTILQVILVIVALVISLIVIEGRGELRVKKEIKM
jgi:hypothetical protein